MHKTVGESLQNPDFIDLFPKGLSVKHEVDVEGLQVDIVAKPRGTKMRLAIEVDGPFHFIKPVNLLDKSPTSLLDGRSRLKHWLLEHYAGTKVVSVAFHEWTPSNGKKKKHNILRRLLQEALARRERSGDVKRIFYTTLHAAFAL